MKIAVSACLLGEACRYDGRCVPNERICSLGEQHELVAICPEQLAGFATPRVSCEIDANMHYAYVHDEKGNDKTDCYEDGAAKALEIAKDNGCELAIFKENSPSCGSEYVYDGAFSKNLIPGSGITTRLFRAEGIRVVSEAKVEECTEALFATNALTTPILTTPRFILRPITEGDAQDVFAYSSNPEVGPDAGWSPHRSIDDSLVFITQICSCPHVFGLTEKDTGRIVGSVGLIPDPMRKNPDALMLGYALGRPWWGKGYMTEAAAEVIRYGFEDLRLSLITCNHYSFNNRSRRVIEKCGFVREGELRGVEATPDGIMQDAVCYSLTKQDYFSTR